VPFGKLDTDFICDSADAVKSIRAVVPPTAPVPAVSEPDMPWKAVSHLRLNYLSLCETGDGSPVEALRNILRIYCRKNEYNASLQEIDGIVDVKTKHITRRMYGNGPAALVRGLEVSVTFDEQYFVGTGCFLLAGVLHQFFSQYVSINSFVETVMYTKQRLEVFRWKRKTGNIQIM
jgi:type VI secretion system protein ImpG